MDPDDFQQAWQTQFSQTRLTIDAEQLLNKVRRNQQQFNAAIWWRDVREVGVALLMVPLWFVMGSKLSLPWTWYLMVPVLIWIAAFLPADRMLRRRRSPEPSEPLRQCLESSLAEVGHQAWLLRNVFWWYILPPALAMLAFFGQLAWETRAAGWWVVLPFTGLVTVEAIVLGVIYRLNQHCVRSTLEPRRQELESLLASLEDEPAGGEE
jgi:hypothetical protein